MGSGDGVLKSVNWRADPPDLFRDPATEVEWWFVQSTVTPEAGPALHLMVAFFQVRAAGFGTPAYMLLTHVINEHGRHGRSTSEISPGLADMHLAIAQKFARKNFSKRLSEFVFDRHSRDVFAQLSEQEVVLVEDSAIVDRKSREIRWRDFQLVALEHEFRLRFVLGGGEPVELNLAPTGAWLCEDGRHLDPEFAPPYGYISCPRLAVTGSIDGDPIAGRAWIERQSGTLNGWFYREVDGQFRLNGWDWLGLSLDNGHDVLAMRPFRVGGGPLSPGFSVIFSGTGVRRIAGGLADEPVSYWVSPKTGARYPVGHRLTLPALDTDLVVQPIDEEQEVPVFGAPAIWQGVVTARGRVDGRAVTGSGRLELFGYGYADTIARYSLRQLRRAISATYKDVSNGIPGARGTPRSP